jgi:hypothetical protein
MQSEKYKKEYPHRQVDKQMRMRKKVNIIKQQTIRNTTYLSILTLNVNSLNFQSKDTE